MNKIYLAIILLLCSAYAYAEAVKYANSYKVLCGTLHGTGYVNVYFNDEFYRIEVDCKS